MNPIMCFTLYFLLILNSTKYDLYYLTLILRNSPILDELLGISPIKFENYFKKIHILDDLKGVLGGVGIYTSTCRWDYFTFKISY